MRIQRIAHEIAVNPPPQLEDIPSLSASERELVLNTWNQTLAPRLLGLCVHQAFEAQVARSPDAVALVCEGQSLTYAQLNARANRAAHVLMGMGVSPGALVGLCTHRSLDMVAGALAIQKAGGAYVPMDPAYPADRIALYIEDSACRVIVTQKGIALPAHKAQVLELDTDGRVAMAPDNNPTTKVGPGDLAYLIYTSGSTGRPKGVMVEHRNVVNFFSGMDREIGPDAGVWLAVTSLSFDISVLELFWTLSRGYKVVLSSMKTVGWWPRGRSPARKRLIFRCITGAMMMAPVPRNTNFCWKVRGLPTRMALWPSGRRKRHFHAFGGPYPNPSVTGAAVAAVTKNIGVRAGSCVVPLHHPARVAEEWAVIDNLTNGRAGLAVASGWHPDDFVLRPENTPPANRDAMFAATDQIRRLWRGEKVDFPTANGGTFGVVTQPRPVSKELPIWVTTAGNPATWREAGEVGANVLTHLLGQSIDEVAGKIRIYHEALRKAGMIRRNLP